MSSETDILSRIEFLTTLGQYAGAVPGRMVVNNPLAMHDAALRDDRDKWKEESRMANERLKVAERERDEHFAARQKLSDVLLVSVQNTEQALNERDEARECLKGNHVYRLVSQGETAEDCQYRCNCGSTDPEGDSAR